jgi:hypothetical protein
MKDCNVGMVLVALVLMSVGIYSLVWGFSLQTSSPLSINNWMPIVCYAIGLLLLGLGKKFKLKALGGMKDLMKKRR